ncbi:hypothetical protein [Rickettsia endosymbiont of Polydrusus tereticollis]|uniref:hypothetical protein n=1 Tax=Rickettsia endosymbiont of Polydrusus tereticollis TaxID=3066251 RepID=UPI003132A11A
MPLTICGLTDIEVYDNHNLTIASSELPLNNINIVHGAINLNNNYEGTVPVAVSVGENSKFTQSGKDLPMNSVTICAQSDFNFTHHGANYHIHNSAEALSTYGDANGSNVVLPAGVGAKIVINNPHEKLDSIIEIAKNPALTSRKDLKKYEENKKFLDSLSENTNLSDEANKIDSYINQHYFELTRVVKQNSTIGLPNEILTHISSYLNLDDVIQPELVGETLSFTGE